MHPSLTPTELIEKMNLALEAIQSEVGGHAKAVVPTKLCNRGMLDEMNKKGVVAKLRNTGLRKTFLDHFSASAIIKHCFYQVIVKKVSISLISIWTHPRHKQDTNGHLSQEDIKGHMDIDLNSLAGSFWTSIHTSWVSTGGQGHYELHLPRSFLLLC